MKSFNYYWTRGVWVFIILVFISLPVIYTRQTPEARFSAFAIVVPFTIQGLMIAFGLIMDRLKSKGP
jgi:hypothetical protein